MIEMMWQWKETGKLEKKAVTSGNSAQIANGIKCKSLLLGYRLDLKSRLPQPIQRHYQDQGRNRPSQDQDQDNDQIRKISPVF